MNIRQKSFISSIDLELANHGYGEEVLKSVTFHYDCTEEQKKDNVAFSYAVGMDSPEWEAYCDEARKKRSEHMARIMEAIAAKLICCQYNLDDNVLYQSQDWDLFFWCNTFWNTTNGRFSGRDYDGFSLTFNDAHSKERREEIYKRLIDALSIFNNDENLSISVQHGIKLDEKKIRQDAKIAAPLLVGKRVQYQIKNELFNLTAPPMEGRVVEHDGKYYFMKKRARKCGYLLDDKAILKIFWDLEKNNE